MSFKYFNSSSTVKIQNYHRKQQKTKFFLFLTYFFCHCQVGHRLVFHEYKILIKQYIVSHWCRRVSCYLYFIYNFIFIFLVIIYFIFNWFFSSFSSIIIKFYMIFISNLVLILLIFIHLPIIKFCLNFIQYLISFFFHVEFDPHCFLIMFFLF